MLTEYNSRVRARKTYLNEIRFYLIEIRRYLMEIGISYKLNS